MRIELKGEVLQTKIKYINQNQLIVILTLFFLFFFVSMGLGYPVLNRYSPPALNALSDSVYYADAVKFGLHGLTQDFRSTRMVLPLIAHGVYVLMPAKIGTWDIASLSMLLVNSFFCATNGILIYLIAIELFNEVTIALTAALLFFLNFSVSNFYLAFLIDSGFAFSFLLLTYLLIKQNWVLLPLMALIGTFIKEAFLPIGFAFVFGWLVSDYLTSRSLNKTKLGSMLVFTMLGSFVVVLLRVFVSDQMKFPWQYMPGMATHAHYVGINLFYTIIRFLYVFIWLLPLALPSVKRLPQHLLMALAMSTTVVFALEWWVGASGAGFGRTLFNLAGGIMCILASITLIDLLKRLQGDQNSKACMHP